MRNLFTAALLAASVSVFQSPLAAQPSPAGESSSAQVEVASVKFDYARAGNDNWLEGAVELGIRPGGRAGVGEFLDRVRVTLSFMVEATDAKGEKRSSFYRSSAEAVALEGGVAVFRFYLPPEVVRRDRLRTDVSFYVVDIEVGGRLQSLVRGAYARTFSTPESVKTFQARVSSEGATNDGVLIPQYFTPFDRDARRPAPSFFRREAHR